MAGVVVDSVVVELQAKIDKYQRDLAAATKQTEDYFKRMHKASSKPVTPTMGRAAGAEKTTVALRDQLEKIKLIETYQRRGLSATEAKARAEQRLTSIITARQRREEQAARRNIEQSLRQNRGGVGLGLQGAATAIVGAVGLNEISQLNDKYIEFTNRLRLAGLEGQNQKEVQDALFASAQRYGVELGSLGGIFQKATEAGREYGATQQQNIQFTNAVAAAVKVQGGSVESARGAILQLGQSLQSGTIRAEEFNSMMEGLFPLLQAAAASSDKYGGSVAKLRAAVVDGKVSSEEFFNLILKGSAILEEKAAKATLTTAAGFTTLTNALTVYFGEADKANGVSAAFGEALGLLARNLGTVIPAIAAITLGYGAYVVGVNAATIATGAFGGALTLLERHPVVLAISALVATLGYLVLSSNDATKATGQFAKVQSEAQEASDKASDAINKLATAHGKARVEAIEQAKAERENVKQKLASAQASVLLAEAEARRAKIAADAQSMQARQGGRAANQGGFFAADNAGNAAINQADANLKAAEMAVIQLNRQLGNINKAIASPEAVATAAGAKAGSANSGPTGPTAAEKEARFQQEMSRLRIEELQARLQLTDDAQARADLQRDILREEYQARVDEINKDFKPEQRQQQIDALNKLYGTPASDVKGDIPVNIGILEKGITRDLLIQQERDAADIAAASNRNAQDLLRSDLQLADTREEKLALELRLLDLAYEQERAELEATKASRELLLGKKAETDAQWRIANDRLQTLDKLKSGDVAAAQRQNESPFAAYARSLSATSFEDQAQGIVVSQLQSVQDGIANALAGAIGTKNSFLKSLISLFVQQVIMRPIAEALSQASGGGGGIFGAILSVGKSLIPRASGGHVTSGNPYLVGENGPELFSPAGSGKIIPTGQLNGMRGGNTIVQQTFVLDNRYGITTTELLNHMNNIASAKATQAASVASRAVYEGIPKRMQQYNINGV